MANALTTAGAPALPERFANPLTQVRGLMAQPAVRRAGPAALMVGLIGAAGLAWATLSTPPQKTLFPNLADADKGAVTSALEQGGITAHIDEASGALTVDEDDYSRARILLAGQGLPKATPGGYAILDQLPMGVSRAVEGERLRQARETELARSIEEIDSVAEARVHLATPEASVFLRDTAKPSASVIVKLQAGRSLSEAQIGSVVNLVASSVPGMSPDAVTVVDQMGALLSRTGGAGSGTQRLDVQTRVEDKYRQQLSQLLTPLVGAGNFTAEVQADVDLDETQATRESYDKTGALRAETGAWTGNQKDSSTGAPGGIPGALSNTPPPAATLQTPQPATGAPGTPAADQQPVAGGPGVNPEKQQDSYQRAYDLDRQVSVTRGAPGGIKRLTVAVLLRDPETGKRTQMEINQVTQLVQSAVGFNQQRGDQVTVISRKFAGAPGADEAQPWYDAAWMPMVARNATAVLIALLVLLLGVRPIAKGLMGKREDATTKSKKKGAKGDAAGEESGDADDGASTDGSGASAASAGTPGISVTPPVGLDQLENNSGFEDRVGAVRGFTRDNPARAALAVRDMIRADAK